MSVQLYSYVGNFNELTESILETYPITKGWKDVRVKFNDLPTMMMKICHDACNTTNDAELLKTNPYVVVERHHDILIKDGKVKNNFAVHVDSEGPASGPCNSILYYYQIDEDIENSWINFYKPEDYVDGLYFDEEPYETFKPKSGDVITFKNDIPHCPGDFKTTSTTPRVRGVLAIFVLHPKPEEPKISNLKRCCVIS